MIFLPCLGGSTSGYYWLERFSEGIAHLSCLFGLDLFYPRCLYRSTIFFFFIFRRCFRRCWVSLTPCYGPLFFLIVDASTWSWQNVLSPIVDEYRFRWESSTATGFVPSRATVELQTGGTESKAERRHGTRKEVPPTD